MTQQIYFLANAKRIKIGTAKDVKKRIHGITAHLTTKVKLLGHIDGGYPLERAIHRYLAEHHIGREWFRDCLQVRQCIAGLQSRGAAAVGFVGDVFKTPPARPFNLSIKQPPLTLSKVVDIIVMCEPRFDLAGFSGESEEACAGWLAGTIPEPKLLRLALGGILMMVMVPNEENQKVLSELGALKAA